MIFLGGEWKVTPGTRFSLQSRESRNNWVKFFLKTIELEPGTGVDT